MDYFFAICQALGIALAVGALAGATGPQGGAAAVLALVAAAAAAAVAALSMSIDDQSILGGIAVGAVGGWLAATVISAVVAGASRRAEGGVGAVGFIVALAAAALVGLSILLPPVSLAALLALGWLALARRRRAQRKYEGLRILR
ncbi:MAG: hypothetical protein AABM43_10870 [Actinomycetota bacterium]